MIADTPQPWPKGRYKRYRARNGCSRNALSLGQDHPGELVVAKGYARYGDRDGMWLGHWWCVDREGRVVDPTWKNAGTAYVRVDTVDVTSEIRRALDSGFWDFGLPQIAPPELVPALERATVARQS